MHVGRGRRLQQIHNYSELESLLRGLSPPSLAQRNKTAEIQNLKERKGHLVAISFHHSPRHPPNPSFLFFKISQDEIFP